MNSKKYRIGNRSRESALQRKSESAKVAFVVGWACRHATIPGDRRHGSAERIIVRPGTAEQCARQDLRCCERPVDLQSRARWLHHSQPDQLRESDLYCGPPLAPPGGPLQLRGPEDGILVGRVQLQRWPEARTEHHADVRRCFRKNDRDCAWLRGLSDL